MQGQRTAVVDARSRVHHLDGAVARRLDARDRSGRVELLAAVRPLIDEAGWAHPTGQLSRSLEVSGCTKTGQPGNPVPGSGGRERRCSP